MSLIEVVIVLAITLLIGAIVFRVMRASWLVYQTATHQAERGMSGLRSLDDVAVEIARAGLGLGADAGPVLPGLPGGLRTADAITLRSNPAGVAGMLQADLTEPDRLVPVEGAELFAAGDEVLLTDVQGAIERAQVTRVALDSLAVRSRETPDGQLQRPFLAATGARVLKCREVRFWLKTDGDGTVVLARKATGQAEQVLARYVGELRFDYLDQSRQPMALEKIGPGRVPGAVRIALRLDPNPALPRVTVPPLDLTVPLEPQSAAIAFDLLAYHTVGVAAVVGQDPASSTKTVGMNAWRRPVPSL